MHGPMNFKPKRMSEGLGLF